MSGEPTTGAPPGELPPSAYREMAAVLRVGLLIALTVLGAAIAALTVRHPGSSSGSWLSPNPLVRYLDLGTFAAGLAHGAPEAYLTLGVFALIATPVVRVITGLYSFARLRERRMVAVTAVVLVLLFAGLFLVGPLVR